MDLDHKEVAHQEPPGHRQQLVTQMQHPIQAAIYLLKRILLTTIIIKAKF
jgi:hypothetical protein